MMIGALDLSQPQCTGKQVLQNERIKENFQTCYGNWCRSHYRIRCFTLVSHFSAAASISEREKMIQQKQERCICFEEEKKAEEQQLEVGLSLRIKKVRLG